MNVFISVISHGHSDLIKNIGCLEILSKKYSVILKSNVKENIQEYCAVNDILHLNEEYNLGFGENNNYIFNHCCQIGMKSDDIFIVLNPDVKITVEAIDNLVSSMQENKSNISAINLFKDENQKVYDNSIRKFPNASDFLFSFLGIKNRTLIDKRKINTPCAIDWAAGSFLAFTKSHFESLNGFDEKYFMYCEDIDICYRSFLKGEKTIFFPHIKAIHFAKHANRSVFSKHFYWHIKSIVRYLCKKHSIINK